MKISKNKSTICSAIPESKFGSGYGKLQTFDCQKWKMKKSQPAFKKKT